MVSPKPELFGFENIFMENVWSLSRTMAEMAFSWETVKSVMVPLIGRLAGDKEQASSPMSDEISRW